MRKIGLGFFLLVFLMSCGNKKTKMDPFATITNLVDSASHKADTVPEVEEDTKVILMYALLYGKLYIDRERLSFTRIEMSLDMQNKSKATTAILYKKPLGLRFKPQELSYLVTYKDVDGKTYLNYIRNTIRFKCDWKRKLFSTSYTVASEMVVTDRKEGVLENIPNKEAFSLNQIFYDKVDEYWNPDFWGNYNIIEPTESLEHAVDKLKKQSN